MTVYLDYGILFLVTKEKAKKAGIDTNNNSTIELQHGDCNTLLKSLPDNSVDLVLTDPPYNISKKNNFTTMGRSGIDFGEWDKNADILSYINELPRIVKDGGGILIFNSWRNLPDIALILENNGFIIKDQFRWIKTNPMPRNRDRRYISDFEQAVWAVTKKGKWTFNRQNDKYERPEFKAPIVAGKEKFHPTQKPISLMEHLISIHSNKNDTVLNPFMGSGSTGIAALNLNRNFIGMELDDSYFNIAQKRMERD